MPDAEKRDEDDLMWQADELKNCGHHYMRVLTAAPGDPHLGNQLPVDAVQNEVLEQLKYNDKIGVRATTGSGKKAKLPGILTKDFKWNVQMCVAQMNDLAARRVVDSLTSHGGWKREEIHL